MKIQIIAVKDTAAQAFMTPSFVHATGVAIREFGDIVNSTDHPISKHPTDYEMYSLGEFDDTTGTFNLPPNPVLLARGVDLVRTSH